MKVNGADVIKNIFISTDSVRIVTEDVNVNKLKQLAGKD